MLPVQAAWFSGLCPWCIDVVFITGIIEVCYLFEIVALVTHQWWGLGPSYNEVDCQAPIRTPEIGSPESVDNHLLGANNISGQGRYSWSVCMLVFGELLKDSISQHGQRAGIASAGWFGSISPKLETSPACVRVQ